MRYLSDPPIRNKRGYKADSEAAILWWALGGSDRTDYIRMAEELNSDINKAMGQVRSKASGYPSAGPACSADPYGGTGGAFIFLSYF